jgi:CRISPR system Cascade subunit CasE
MYLSRLILNPRSRQVRSELANSYEMHRTVMHAFLGNLMDDERVLFRLEIQPSDAMPLLLVQSPGIPDWSFLVVSDKNYLIPVSECPPGVNENPGIKPFEPVFHIGQTLIFRLKANPTVKKDRENKKQGRRVGLYREEDQYHWIERKLEAAGAALVSARTSEEGSLKGEKKQNQAQKDLTFFSVIFDGFLQVKNPDLLVKAVSAGIGSGKGLGFGLLSLAPAR